MKRLLTVIAVSMTVLACSAARAQVSKDQMVADWQRAKNYTKAYLDAMPDDGYSFKPKPEMRTFAEQMLHLTDGNYYLAGPVTGKPGPLGDKSAEKTITQTKEATTKAVMDSYDYIIAAIQSLTQEQLQEKVRFHQRGEVTKAVLLSKAFEHQTHHRGQTTVYLRLKDVTPPGEMLF